MTTTGPKTIWLSGVSSGLGRELAKLFTAGGHRLAACARREDKLAELRAELPGEPFLQALDVSDDKAVAEFCEAAFARTGAPDLLINNASIINPPAPLWEISAADFDRLTAINLSGTANFIRHSVPHMMAAGRGVIVNLSSGWGRSTSPEVAPYCASKWAIEGLSSALAQELPRGLAVVALNPGIINTDMLQTAFGDEASHYRSPAEWAATAAPFLLKLDERYNGQALTAP